MSAATGRIANAARPPTAKATRPQKGGRIVVPTSTGFEIADLFRGNPTPERIVRILKTAVEGEPREQFELFDTMCEMDGHLRSVFETRKMAIGGLNWELVPANEISRHPKINDAKAKAVHEYCAAVIAEIDGFDCALQCLPDAIGRGLKVAEVEYRAQVPVALHCVEDALLTCDHMNPSRLRIRLESDWNGIAIDEFPEGKWIVHRPVSIGGLAVRGALLRPAAPLFCIKVFAKKGWAIYNELFGMPITVAKYGQPGDTETRKAMTKLIRDLGLNRGGLFPEGTEIEFVEAANRGQLPYERIAKYIDAEFSKLFLGQTLTTEIGETGGAKAAATVHNEVRKDLLKRDISNEGETIRSRLIIPIARQKFGDEGVMHAPYFRRVIEEARDLLDMAELLDRAVNRLGAKVPKSVVQDELGIRLTDDEKPGDALPGATGGDPFGNDLTFNKRAGRSSLTVHRRKLIEIVKRRRTPAARMSAWIMAAVLATAAHTSNVIAAVSNFIEKRRDSETALADLPQMFDLLPVDEMQAVAEQSVLAAKMAGILDAQRKLGINRSELRVLLAHAEIDFNRIPFERAIGALRDRIGLDPDEFAALELEARSRASRVAGVYDMGVLATIHQALVKSIANGEISRDFRVRLPSMADAAGWSGENPYHADLVCFQNFMMAHAAGRFSEYVEFGAAGWMFVSNGDACPICQPYVNKVFKLTDRKAFPPLHFWCDCEDEVVFEDEVSTFDDSKSTKNGAHDDELAKDRGFKFDPAQYANVEPLKIGGFPKELQPAFRKFGEGRGWEVIE
ncbi:MAG: DUF935 family protein [Phycisphaerae bacterium]|nr:DUF935 family protein [Phycisphaerae bacterium]